MIHVPRPPDYEAPVVVEVFADPGHAEGFVPKSRVRLGSGFRQLAASVPPDRLRDLLVVASFATANGRVAPSPPEIAGGLGVAVWQARLRAFRLARTEWQGQPLVSILRYPDGRTLFSPGPLVLERRQELPPAATPSGVAPANGDKVREESRRRYARRRETVEREISARQGWLSPEEMEDARQSLEREPEELDAVWAANRLSRAGVDYGLAVRLVRQYGAEACLRQAAWIEYRTVKNRARYLVSAIQNDYARPAGAPTALADPDPSRSP